MLLLAGLVFLASMIQLAFAECSFSDPVWLIKGSLQLRQYIANDVVTLEVEREGQGWIGLGFANRMVGSRAVIALPEADSVKVYNLGGFAPNLVTPLDDDDALGLLTNSTIVQTNTRTTLTFTRPVTDPDGSVIVEDGVATNLIFAIGQSNVLGYHGGGSSRRGTASIAFGDCAEVDG